MLNNNPPVNSISFSSWLRLQLQQTGSSITDFSKYLGITRTCVYRYLGRCYDKRFLRAALPSSSTMLKILEYFDLPITPDFLESTRPRGWIPYRSRRKYARIKKKMGSEYYPVEDREAFALKEKVLTTKNNNEV